MFESTGLVGKAHKSRDKEEPRNKESECLSLAEFVSKDLAEEAIG